jgi:hypothetical protein
MRRFRTKSRRTGLLIGVVMGAGAGVLLTIMAGTATGTPISVGPIVKNAMAGAAIGGLASFLGARPAVAAMTAGTGIYLTNIVRAGAGA